MYRDALHLKTTVGYWDHLQNDSYQIAMDAPVEIIRFECNLVLSTELITLIGHQ